MEEGWTTNNPVVGTRRPQGAKPRERVLSDAELVALWRACCEGEFGKTVRLLILTGARRAEVGGMAWSELVLDGFGTSYWTLPEQRSKNHRSHVIPLSPPALAIIKSVPQQEGRDQLFGVRAEGFSSGTRGKQALDQRLGDAVKPWRLHDIRRTVATGMAGIGIEPHIIEAVLNHYSAHRAGIHGVYNLNKYETQAKSALQRWSRHVLDLIEGRESKVVPLHAS
jgi:integrase